MYVCVCVYIHSLLSTLPSVNGTFQRKPPRHTQQNNPNIPLQTRFYYKRKQWQPFESLYTIPNTIQNTNTHTPNTHYIIPFTTPRPSSNRDDSAGISPASLFIPTINHSRCKATPSPPACVSTLRHADLMATRRLAYPILSWHSPLLSPLFYPPRSLLLFSPTMHQSLLALC